MSEGPTGNHKTTKECDCQDTSFPSQSNNFLVWHGSKVYYMYVGIATVQALPGRTASERPSFESEYRLIHKGILRIST